MIKNTFALFTKHLHHYYFCIEKPTVSNKILELTPMDFSQIDIRIG